MIVFAASCDLGVDMPTLVKDGDVSLAGRLNVLVSLHLDHRCPSTADKIAKLAASALNSGEIGQIVGKPTNYVTATLSQGKKRKGKGKE